jgi:hypothetical protein
VAAIPASTVVGDRLSERIDQTGSIVTDHGEHERRHVGSLACSSGKVDNHLDNLDNRLDNRLENRCGAGRPVSTSVPGSARYRRGVVIVVLVGASGR